MSVRIRLTRMGRRNRPYYRVVIADSRSRRDGNFIEQVGTYDPIKQNNKNFTVAEDRIFHWLRVGAKPTDTVKYLLSEEGIMLKWHLENSNLSEDKKKQELQKWEMAKTARTQAAPAKKAPAEEKKEEAAKETVAPAVEEAPAVTEAEAPAEEAVEETPVAEEAEAAAAETPADADVKAEEPVAEEPVQDEAAPEETEASDK